MGTRRKILVVLIAINLVVAGINVSLLFLANKFDNTQLLIAVGCLVFAWVMWEKVKEWSEK